MLYLHTRRNRQARNSTSWGEVACLQVAALEPTCQNGGKKNGRKASEVMISLKNLAIVYQKRNWFLYHRKWRNLFKHGRKHYNNVVYKLLRRFWDLPKRVRSFSKFVFLLIISCRCRTQYPEIPLESCIFLVDLLRKLLPGSAPYFCNSIFSRITNYREMR